MGLLAYDPERLAHLRSHLAAAADELHSLRETDPAASRAMQLVMTIRNQIDQVWLPVIARILESTALTTAWRRSPDAADNLHNALIAVMVNGYGWSVQRDPLSDVNSNINGTPPTAAEARALGAMLNKVDLVKLVGDREQLHWLVQRLLLIGNDSSLSAEFLANFNSWRSVTYVLGGEYARGDRPDIEEVFDGLMSVWSHTLPSSALLAGKSATLAALLPPIKDVDPYVQALMVRSLHLDAMTVATLTSELLTRWVSLKNDPSAPATLDHHDGTTANAADLLLPLLLGDPAACVWFTELATTNPAELFETLNDPEVAYRVALIGTDPKNTSVAAAGRAVLAILDYFRVDPYLRPGFDTDGHPGEYGLFLGGLVAPWLVQFTMSNDDWTASDGNKASLLRVALRDEQALTQLTADADRIRVGFNKSLSTYDQQAANQVGELLNLLFQLSVNERVDDEIASTDSRFNLMWAVVGAASGFVPGGPLVGVANGLAIAALQRKLDEYLGQPDPRGVRRTTERAMDVALALAGADAVARLYQQWISDGKVVASHSPPAVDVTGDGSWCPSAEYHADFDRWRRHLPGGINGTLSDQANDLLSAFVGVSAAQSSCAEIAG